MSITRILFPAALLALASAPAAAGDHAALARLHDTDGRSVGTVQFTATPFGTLLHARLAYLPAGVHAFHIHETGECTPPFTSAGGHFNPAGTGHGLADDDGHHAGDMPNLHVAADGLVHLEVFNASLKLDDKLFDDDGAAVVMHEGPDDYRTDPAGAAGPRIACGVIERAESG
ncbi:MAG: superoxide dismutase family protein [Wenzhouxiangellaceae bacterium]|nr:superoxide dismutase family protein [Wenzhouxiangellaceae bacterium]